MSEQQMNERKVECQANLGESVERDETGTPQAPSIKPVEPPSKGKFPERYKIHQYWARKPWYIVRAYIDLFTNRGETVLDPFIGSGVTACESLAIGRKVIASDLNPISILITKVTCYDSISVDDIKRAFASVFDDVSNELSWLYVTRCPNCRNDAVIINTIWSSEQPTLIYYNCHNCGNKGQKNVEEIDLHLIDRISNVEIPHWYPRTKAPPGSDVESIDKLFTKRNLIALSSLYSKIESVQEDRMKNILQIMFSSTLIRASKLIFVNKYRLKKGVNPAGVWGIKRYWVPDEFVENNVLYYFRQRLPKLIKAKRETNKLLRTTQSVENAFRARVASATSLEWIEDNSIDYCFTDPPYGGAIDYFSLSAIWNEWLKLNQETKDELIIRKDKPLQEYAELLNKSVGEIFRVLKPERYFTITFHSSKIEIWNSLLTACNNAGFQLIDVIPQEPIKKSHNQIQLTGAVETDLIITFRKSDESRGTIQQNASFLSIEDLAKRTATELLERNGSVSTAEIYDAILLKWIKWAFSNTHATKDIKFTTTALHNLLLNSGFKPFNVIHKDYKYEDLWTIRWRL
jgi:adenine-specific DNA methylase